MLNLHIVTDSSAHFSNSPLPHNVTIVPNKLVIGGKTYREGVDITNEEAFRFINQANQGVEVIPPSVAEYTAVYERLTRHCDGIISLHPSREILDSWQNAQLAAQPFNGRCRIAVIDTQTLSGAQGMIVRLAAREALRNEDFEDIVRITRGAVDHSYCVYFVETLDHLMVHRILPPSQSIIGAMLNIKPVLTIEDGRLIAIEKVRTRLQAIERLVEFVIEFTEFEDMLIMQHRSGQTEQTRMLQDRLKLDFPDVHFPHAMYGASLAALIGTDATGLAVLENQNSHGLDDEF